MTVVAIDGPGGSGKSTVAAHLARRLGLAHLDTGAMYRAVAALALERGTEVGDTDAVAGLAGIAAGAPAVVGWLTAGLVIPLGYLAGVTAVSAALSRGVPAGVRARLPLVLGVMHMCWGAGFLTSPRHLHRPAREPDARVGQTGAAGERAAAGGRE